MIREAPNIRDVYQEVYDPRFNLVRAQAEIVGKSNPLLTTKSGVRQLSASAEDLLFGDAGKGHVIQEINRLLLQLSKSGIIYSGRYNGTANTGREINDEGVDLNLHQLPVGVTQEGVNAIMMRGMLLHPEDLVNEIDYVKSKDRFKGNLIIDRNIVLALDLHRAFEGWVKDRMRVGEGSTGSGVAQGYSSVLEKRAKRMWHLLDDENWEDTFRKEYRFYADLVGGVTVLSSLKVNALDSKGDRFTHSVGSEDEFIDRLRNSRSRLTLFVRDIGDEISDVWHNHPNIPFSFEAGQGDALDADFGVYPDVTASKPVGRFGIPAATEGIVQYDEIAVTSPIIKIPYTSHVGERRPPYGLPEDEVTAYRNENDEFGKATKRPRGILPLDIVLQRYMAEVANPTHIAFTHADSARVDRPVKLVVGYKDRETGEPARYRPYQWEWDKVEADVVEVPAWNGEVAAYAGAFEDLPENARRLIIYEAKVLNRPVSFITRGRERGRTIYTFRTPKKIQEKLYTYPAL